MFRFAHSNFYVADLDRSLAFYREALDLTEACRMDTGDSLVVYLKDKADSHFMLELIWLKDGTRPESTSELHLAFSSEDMPGAKVRHAAMNCICYEDDFLCLYFIMDPDGYWLCIMPEESPLQKPPAN